MSRSSSPTSSDIPLPCKQTTGNTGALVPLPCGRVQHVRMSLDPWATPYDRAPLYIVYHGPIQGAWVDMENVRKIVGLGEPYKFCMAYSWRETLYTRAAGESFVDIATGRPGWPRLYAILLELFGSEAHFVLGPRVVEVLEEINNTTPFPTLTSVLAHVYNQRSRRLSHLAPNHPSNDPSTRTPTHISTLRSQFSRQIFQIPKITTSLGISMDVAVGMHLLDSWAFECRGPSYRTMASETGESKVAKHITAEETRANSSLAELETSEGEGVDFAKEWGPEPIRPYPARPGVTWEHIDKYFAERGLKE